jgi:tetratricopeptide (TPR) repeat protein/lambda repressor-like predicted transcriptional regulator
MSRQSDPKVPASHRRIGRNAVGIRGDLVRARRSELGWSQEQLTERAGLHESNTVSNVERLHRGYRSTASRLAAALGLPTEMLVIPDGEETRHLLVVPGTSGSASEGDRAIGRAAIEQLTQWLGQVPRWAITSLQDSDDDSASTDDPVMDLRLQTLLRIRGQTVRMSARLVNFADSRTLADIDLPAPREDLCTVLAEAFRVIARVLDAGANEQQAARLVSRLPLNPTAHEAYLAGRAHWSRPNESGLRQAIESFNTAITLEPQYAAAHAGLADSLNLLSFAGFEPAHVTKESAIRAAAVARGLAPDLPDGHAAYAAAAAYFEWDYKKAEQAVRIAIDVNPSYATAHHVNAMAVLLPQCRLGESLAAIREAHRLYPRSPFTSTCVGIVLYHSREYTGALEEFREVLGQTPDYHLALWHQALTLTALRRHNDAISSMERAAHPIDSGGAQVLAALGYCYALGGRTDSTERVLKQLKDMSAKQYVSPHCFALPHLGLGHFDKALDLLEEAVVDRSPSVCRLNVDPVYDRVRESPRFGALLKSVGLRPALFE